MERTFFELTTEDITDPFYKAKVEVKEDTGDSFMVADIISGKTRTFLKKDDPSVISYVAIEDPTKISETQNLYTFLNKESDDTGNTAVQEQLRLEEQFGSYSAITREQSLYLIGKFMQRPKEIAIAMSPHPNMPLENLSDEPLFLSPDATIRSNQYIPIVDAESTGGSGSLNTEDIPDYSNTPYIDLIRNSYRDHGVDSSISYKVSTSSKHTLEPYLHSLRPTQIRTTNNLHQQIPPQPYLLYDIRTTSALTYGQLKVKTCMKQDPLSRSKIFEEVNIPIFAPSLHIPLTDYSIKNSIVKKLLKTVTKESVLPLLVSPYSYSVLPTNNYSQIGLDTNLMNEEYERHYVSPSTLITPHPMNSMDAYIYENLYAGIDVDNYNPNKDKPIPYKFNPYDSPLASYVVMPYIPEPILLNDYEKTVLQWCESTFPTFKPLVEQYKLTKTPQIWFEFLSNLWKIHSVSATKIKEEHIVELKNIFNYPSNYSVTDIRKDVEEKEKLLQREQKTAEKNQTVCYGLSIRKLYVSLEAFQEDVATAEQTNKPIYWDSDRDTLKDDIQFLLQRNPDFQSLTEEEIANMIQEHIPFISNYEVSRRAFEIKEGNKQSQIRPGDLIMIRLPNATYIYQKTSDGWTSRTQNLDETEYCQSNAKGYTSLTVDQLIGTSTLEDGCSFIDKKCVPNSVQKWIESLTQIQNIKNKLSEAENIDTILEDRKNKLESILRRMLTYSRVLPKVQISSLTNDSWSRVNTLDVSAKSKVFELIDLYEKARTIPDFTQSWLEVESILDRETRFDSEVRAYVEPITRTPIACEHTTFNILAARSSNQELAGKYMTQLVQEYGNFDEVGQKAICKICGEEIGADIVSAQEGFGSDDAPIQLRSVVDIAVSTDYQSLPKPAQKVYQMVLALRDNSNITIDETNLVRATGIWYAKFMVESDDDSVSNFLFHLSHISDSIRKYLIIELIKIRIQDFFKRPENAKLLQTKDKKLLIRNKQVAKKSLAKEITSFIKKVPDYLSAPTLKEEDITEIKSYMTSVASISSSLREKIFGEINEYKNVSYAILILIFAIQTADKLSSVGLASAPGLIRLEQPMLYEADHEMLMRYLVYLYAKKYSLRDYQKDSLLSVVLSNNQKQMSEEAIKKAMETGINHLNTLLASSLEEEEKLTKQDRIFTPNRDPYSESFRTSFRPEHPIQRILDTYGLLNESNGVEYDPKSIGPNTWMSYDESKTIDESVVEYKYATDTLAIDISLTRFPLTMPRLESMRESNDRVSVENDIISFSSQYNLETGSPLRKLQLRSGGLILDTDAFIKLAESRIPEHLFNGNKDWIEKWIEGYKAYAGPVGSLLEYDLDSQSLIGSIVDKTRQQLKVWRDEAGDDGQYTRRILSYRNRIRSSVGQANQVTVSKSIVPVYDLIPRMTASIVPEWYSSYTSFVAEQIESDTTRLVNYLTQMNIRGEQVDLSVSYLQKKNRLSYDLDFKQLMTSIYYDMYRNKSIKRDDQIKLKNKLSNGDELIDIGNKNIYGMDEWKNILDVIVNKYAKITEGVIEAHTAEVLARQNRERKQRADKFTEEESGLNKLYREFQLGRQFVSIDEMGMVAEMTQMDEQFADAELIDEEEAMDLMMGMGEDEGQYEFGEYDSL